MGTGRWDGKNIRDDGNGRQRVQLELAGDIRKYLKPSLGRNCLRRADKNVTQEETDARFEVDTMSVRSRKENAHASEGGK